MTAKRRLSFAAALAFLLAMFAAAPAFADSLDDYRARGFITERFDGYTQVRGDAPPGARALVAEVNEKRAKIYAKRAQTDNVPLDTVGKIYATQIYEDAPAGTWFLQADGKYIKK
jgi:uncharacterized protein